MKTRYTAASYLIDRPEHPREIGLLESATRAGRQDAQASGFRALDPRVPNGAIHLATRVVEESTRTARLFTSRSSATTLATLLAFGLIAAPASARGTTRVQQADGSVQTYTNVEMQMSGATLRLRSSDRKATLEVASSACSLMGEVQRCLPYATTLTQHGATHTIGLERGTVYMNLSGETQPMRHTSQTLGPHEVLLLLHTTRGTIVSVKGTLDGAK
jgi:hypothetical protein